MKPKSEFVKKAFLGGLVLAFALALIGPAEAITMTGGYVGNGNLSKTITSGLTNLKSIRIVSLPSHGRSIQAYTNIGIQGFGQGTFLNDVRVDNGILLNGGDFIIAHPDFNEVGVPYGWEANGD